jgi:hypothetical protein
MDELVFTSPIGDLLITRKCHPPLDVKAGQQFKIEVIPKGISQSHWIKIARERTARGDPVTGILELSSIYGRGERRST